MIIMRNKCNIISSLLFVLALTACSYKDIDPKTRPIDYSFDYWVSETTQLNALNKNNIYEERENRTVYLDSDYSLTKNEDNTVILPKKYVLYNFLKRKDCYIVSSVHITDPNVTIYGLSMASEEWEIDHKFKKYGFSYNDHYSGFSPCYSKNDVEIRIDSSSIYVSYFAALN